MIFYVQSVLIAEPYSNVKPEHPDSKKSNGYNLDTIENKRDSEVILQSKMSNIELHKRR